MFQCIFATTTSKKEPYFTIKYGSIKKRRGYKKTIIVVDRMMIVCIYHMVSKKQSFNPTDNTELMDSYFNQPKIILNNANIFAYLDTRGYNTSLLVKCNDK